MSYLEIAGFIIVAFALAMPAFSVSLFTSIYRCVEMDEAMTIGLFFSLFQAVLLLLGWLIGYSMAGFFGSLLIPIVVILFLFIGMRMFFEGRRMTQDLRTYAVKSPRSLAGFSLAISINVFLTGVGLGLLGIKIWIQAAILLFITFIIVQIGIRLGKFGRYRFGRQAEMLGGGLMMLLAIIIMLQYVM